MRQIAGRDVHAGVGRLARGARGVRGSAGRGMRRRRGRTGRRRGRDRGRGWPWWAQRSWAIPPRASRSPRAPRGCRPRPRRRARPPRGRHARRAIDRDPPPVALRTVARRDGFLTGPSSASPARVALRFVRRRSGALGLRASDLRALHRSGSYRAGGITYLSWTQTYRGIPSVDGGLRAAVTARRPAPGAAAGARAGPGAAPRPSPGSDAGAAVALAARSVGAPAPGSVTSGPAGPDRAARFDDGTRAALAVAGEPGAARLAWRVLLLEGERMGRGGGRRHGSGAAQPQPHPRGHREGPSQLPRRADRRWGPDSHLDPAWLGAANRLEGPNTHVVADPQDAYTAASLIAPRTRSRPAGATGTSRRTAPARRAGRCALRPAAPGTRATSSSAGP